MFFETALLCTYNFLFSKIIITNCKCYDDYKDFYDYIINKRNSYMACFGYTSNSRNRVAHRAIPIYLGSYIDQIIRGKEAIRECRPQWCFVILRGILKGYSSFSTFGKFIHSYTSFIY
jgi:hypothetical protein